MGVSRWRIRPARETDLDQIALLETETFSDPWSRKAYQDILRQDRYCILVLTASCDKNRGYRTAEHPDTENQKAEGGPGEKQKIENEEIENETESICGYLCGMSVLDEGELHRIAVVPSQRGQGYGQRLLEAFFEILRERGVVSIYLEVRAGNTPAVGLYRKTGFEPAGIRKAYYQNPKEDAQIMQKTVSPGSM